MRTQICCKLDLFNASRVRGIAYQSGQLNVNTLEEHSLDKWLRRLSHLSQFGLFLFTVGALYFTVLPLYQKALLDEAIARKEVELKQANEDLEKSYVGLRVSVIREYILFSGFDCSGMWDSDETGSNSSNGGSTVAGRIFGVNVHTCLEKMLKTKEVASNLRHTDYEFLVNQIQLLSGRLSVKLQKAMVEHDSIPERARVDPESIPPLTGIAAKYLDLEEKFYEDLNRARISGPKLEPKVSFDKERFKYAIAAEQNRVATEYGSAIRNELSSLKQLKWP